MQRLNECGQKVSSKNFCGASTSTYVWEAILVKLHFNFYDWHIMKPPFRLQLAFAGDGIGFVEVGNKGIYTRCTRWKQFIPPQNSDYTWPDTERDNQWSRSELTIGPQGVIRSIINSSTDWISLLDETDRGIICLYDKLWLYSYLFYNYDGKANLNYDISYEIILQPVKINRIDYLEHLIERTRCGNECFDQDVWEYPCISRTCVLPQEYVDGQDYEVFDFETLKTIKVKGSKLKQKIKDNTPSCIDVCVVSGGSDCSECEKKLSECTQENTNLKLSMLDLQKINADLTARNVQLVTENNALKDQVAGLNNEVDKLNDQVTDLEDQVIKGKGELIKCNNSLTFFKEQNKKLYDENAELEHQVKEKNSEIFYLQSDLRKANATIATQKTEIDSLNKKVTDLNTQIDSLNKQMTSLNDKINYYKTLDLKVIISKYAKVCISLTAREMENYDCGESCKAWLSLWTDSYKSFGFGTQEEITEMNELLSRWGNAAPLLQQQILIYANFVIIMNLLNDGPNRLPHYKFLDIFKPEVIKDANIIYERTIRKTLTPLSFDLSYGLDYILNWSPLSLQKTKPASSESQEDQSQEDFPFTQSQEPPKSQENQEKSKEGEKEVVGDVNTGQTQHGDDNEDSMDTRTGTTIP